MTGTLTEMESKVGGNVSAFGGMLHSTIVELVPNKRIVQMWRSKDWPEGVQSTVTWEIAPSNTGSTVVFTHTGIPAAEFDNVSNGWKDHYWAPMKLAAKK